MNNSEIFPVITNRYHHSPTPLATTPQPYPMKQYLMQLPKISWDHLS